MNRRLVHLLIGLVMAVAIIAGTASPSGAAATYSDVPFDHPFSEEIEWTADQGLMTGFSDGTFRPSRAITRAAITAILYRLAGEPAFTPPSEPTFSDVAPTSPFFLQIEWVADEGVLNGFGDGTYRPDKPLSRVALAALAYRASGDSYTPPGTATFNDVAVGSQFFTEVEWIADLGVLQGWPDGSFRPSRSLTRQALAAILFRGLTVTT